MTAAAVIEGDFATYRLIPSRGVFQAVIEFPIERQEQFFAALGYPIPGKTIRVAMARLQNPADELPVHPAARFAPPQTPSSQGASPAKDLAKSELMRQLYASLPPGDKVVSQAGMLAKAPAFQSWIGGVGSPAEEEAAADFIRRYCGIKSRSEFADNEMACQRFARLNTEFMMASGRIAEVR